MRALGVVVDPPGFNRSPGAGQVSEQVLVEAFVAEPAVEAFDEPVLLRLAGAMECHSTDRSSCQRRMACDVNSVPLSLTIIAG